MWFLFAVEAAAEGGNPVFQLFENNLINWIVLIVAIVWFAAKSLPAVFEQRKAGIDAALSEARLVRTEGETFLVTQQQRIANAEKESDNILVEAKQMADKMRTDMELSTKKEIADLETRIEQEIGNQRQLAIMQLRTAAARAAISLSEEGIPKALTDDMKGKLVNNFIDQLEANGVKK
jgi:F0F1-type ATP synthase membrane subunit b/b'